MAFQFLHAGQFLVAREQTTEDRLMEVALEAGADDVITTEQGYAVRCNIHAFDRVAQAMEGAGLQIESAEIAYIPRTLVRVSDLSTAQTLLKLHDALDSLDDVQAVYSNEEMDEQTADQIDH